MTETQSTLNPLPGGFAYLFSYSGYIIFERDAQIPALDFLFDGRKVVINSPTRLADRCWRPIPQLNAVGAKRLFGDDLDPVPLQVLAMQAIGHPKAPALTPLMSRGGEFDPEAPPDTIMIIVEGADSNFQHAPLVERVMIPMFVWLRVLSKQWWIARSAEGQTGNLHFTFEIQPGGKLGEMFAPFCQQTAPDIDAKKVSSEMWMQALNNTLKGSPPPWNEVLLGDIIHYKSNREYITSILLFCGWLETERNSILERYQTKISDLKVSPTDILKQISDGFERVFGRSLQREFPTDFEFIKSLWRSRGEFAHGKPFRWEFSGEKNLSHYQPFSEHLERVRKWFDSI